VIGDLQCRCAAGIRYRDNNINIVFGEISYDLARELLTHTQTRFVDRQIIENRIRSSEIDVFKNARCMCNGARIIMAVQRAIVLDDDAFSRINISQPCKLQYVQRNTFRSHHVALPAVLLSFAEYQRTDTVRVPERNYAKSHDERDDGVTPFAALVQRFNGSEYIFCCGTPVKRSSRISSSVSSS